MPGKKWTKLSLSKPSAMLHFERAGRHRKLTTYMEFIQKRGSTEVPQQTNDDDDDLADDAYYIDLYHSLTEKEFNQFNRLNVDDHQLSDFR